MLVTFRPCGPRDHGTLLRLVSAYYRYDKLRPNGKALSQGLHTLLRAPALGQAWMLEIHHKAIGYAILTYNFDLEYGGIEGMLTELFVEKKYRDRGVGSLALYEIEDFCREHGIRAVELQVQHHNRHAAHFYRKAGFRDLRRQVLLFDVPAEAPANRKKKPTIAGKRR